MRIGFGNISQPPGKITGISVYAWTILRHMLPHLASDEIVVFSPWARDDLPLDVNRAEVVTLPFIQSQYMRLYQEHLVLPGMLKRCGIDVYFSVAPSVPLRGATPSVMVVHDLYFSKFPQTMRWDGRLLEGIATRRFLSKASATITVSDTTKRDLLHLFPNPRSRVTTIHEASPIDADGMETVQGPVEAGRYALFVANVTGNKNPEVLAEAAAMLGENEDLKFVHVGRDDRGLLEAAVTRNGVGNRFMRVGTVSDAELARWYAGALCVVMPSHYEGFGLPALEAQARRVPLISSNGGALPEVAGEGALLFSPSDALGLVSHLRSVADERVRAELIAKGDRNVSRFSWDRAAQLTLDVIRGAARS